MKADIRHQKNKPNIAGYLFIVPAMFFFCMYILYPIIFIIVNSLKSWATMSDMKFVGLTNYVMLFHDKVFWTTIRNAGLSSLITAPVPAIMGFLLAYTLEIKIHSNRARNILRTIFFIPVVISVTVVAIMFSKIFQPYQGIIGYYLHRFFNLSPTINVLGNDKAAIFGVMLANIWEWTGWSMIMYVGGLAQVSEDLIEAAKIDGANTAQEIFYIFVPMLSSVHKSLLMLGIIGSLQTYALVSVMTGGGPNHASEMPGTYIFQKGFTENSMGYACAISVAMLFVAFILTIVQVKFLGSGDFISGEKDK